MWDIYDMWVLPAMSVTTKIRISANTLNKNLDHTGETRAHWHPAILYLPWHTKLPSEMSSRELAVDHVYSPNQNAKICKKHARSNHQLYFSWTLYIRLYASLLLSTLQLDQWMALSIIHRRNPSLFIDEWQFWRSVVAIYVTPLGCPYVMRISSHNCFERYHYTDLLFLNCRI